MMMMMMMAMTLKNAILDFFNLLTALRTVSNTLAQLLSGLSTVIINRRKKGKNHGIRRNRPLRWTEGNGYILKLNFKY